MAGLKTFPGGSRRAKRDALSLVTVVCLVLLTLLAVVQVVHVHQVNTDADHCPLCIVMHSAAPVAVTAAVVVLIAFGSRTTAYQARTVTRHWHPKLFTRPPPDGYQG